MSNSSDSAYSIFIIAVLFVFLVTAIGMTIDDANEEQTKREAIKAGLVQDNEGHWVRPELEKEERNE